MNGRFHIRAQRGTANLTTNLDWRVAGIGDLNGDGRDDVLLRHVNGSWHYYPMNGRFHIRAGSAAPQTSPPISTGAPPASATSTATAGTTCCCDTPTEAGTTTP